MKSDVDIEKSPIQLKFSDADWQRLETDWTAWWNHELDRPLVVVEVPHLYNPKIEFTKEFMQEKTLDEMLDHYQSRLETTRFYGDAWPRWFPNFGPGIMAAFLGATVHFDEESSTIWYAPESEVKLSELHLEMDANNFWWQRIRNLTQAALDRWGDRVNLAHTDFTCNLDILASLCSSEKLLLALLDDPVEVQRLLSDIRALWKIYWDELYAIIRQSRRGTSYWAQLWSPKRYCMLQSDFSYMISPQMFEQFVLADIQELSEFLDFPFYHLDGVGQIAHLDMLLSIEQLKGIQWIPGAGQPPPEKWLSLLKRIRNAGKLCHVYATAAGAMEIVKELGGNGFAFYILDDLTDQDAFDFCRIIKRA